MWIRETKERIKNTEKAILAYGTSKSYNMNSDEPYKQSVNQNSKLSKNNISIIITYKDSFDWVWYVYVYVYESMYTCVCVCAYIRETKEHVKNSEKVTGLWNFKKLQHDFRWAMQTKCKLKLETN